MALEMANSGSCRYDGRAHSNADRNGQGEAQRGGQRVNKHASRATHDTKLVKQAANQRRVCDWLVTLHARIVGARSMPYVDRCEDQPRLPCSDSNF